MKRKKATVGRILAIAALLCSAILLWAMKANLVNGDASHSRPDASLSVPDVTGPQDHAGRIMKPADPGSHAAVDDRTPRVRFRADVQGSLVRAKRNLLLYPDAQITERRYHKGKIFAQSPLSNVRSDIQGALTVTELTKHAVEAELDLTAIEAFLRSDAEFLSLPVSAEEEMLFRVERIHDRGEHTVTLAGTLAGQDISEALLVVHDGVVYGTLHLLQQGRIIEYGAAGNGDVAIRELDLREEVYGTCAMISGDPLEGTSFAAGDGPMSVHGENTVGSTNAFGEVFFSGQHILGEPFGTTNHVADFVVTYNQLAQDALGGVAATEAKVIMSIDAITTAMMNSGIVDFQAALLATALETEMAINDWTAVSVLLEDRKTNADATYAYASELRDLTGADIAVYMYSGASGSAGELNSFEFSIGSSSIASAGSNFTHEFGHCCGALHAWGDSEAISYPYTGWRFILGGLGYRTIMSYTSPFTAGSARVGYFSNPYQTLTVTDGGGTVTDEAALGAPLGYDARGDIHADPTLVRGGRGAVFTTNGTYVSGGYNQSGFDGTQANLGAMNQVVVNNARAAKSGFRNRASHAILESPSGSYLPGDLLSFFVFSGDQSEAIQMDLYRDGVYVQTIDPAVDAHAHEVSWTIPGTGLPGGTNYQVYFSSAGGSNLQSTAFGIVALGNEYHVATNGNNSGDGSLVAPFLTIQHAADIAQPGDTITVHQGVYRERVNPPRGGTSDLHRITYRAASGAVVVVKGSEPVSGWTHVTNDTWKVKITNTFFGAFNPFREILGGDWFTPLNGRIYHPGSVFLDGHWLWEAANYADVLEPAGSRPLWFTNDKDNNPGDGTSEGDEATMTTIWAQFPGIADPDAENTEISARQTVFYPGTTGNDYITVRGFIMEHAATPWAPPTREQIGLIGCNWSKGWIIEDNVIRYSACAGVTLGKYGDGEDTSYYQGTIQRALSNGWNKATVGSHLVRNNHISHCEQAGVVGSLGPIFSTISSNTIHDIHVRKLFSGFEMAGIKLHGAVDCIIDNNTISNVVTGIWLDWMAQGTRLHGNFLCNNERDMFFEVNHGPFLVDNNLLCSPESIYSVSRGGAYVHNLVLGNCQVNHLETRSTPYFLPHSTDVVDFFHPCPSGDERFYNNIFYGYGLAAYDAAALPVFMEGNVFLNGAKPSTNEISPLVITNSSAVRLIPKADGAYLHVSYDASWGLVGRPLVTTELLGTAAVPNVVFEHPDGSPYRIDTDFFGAARDTNNPCAGPFAFIGGETNVFQIRSYSATNIPPNTLAHWSFDEPAAGGAYADSSGSGRDIAVTVAPTYMTNGAAVGSGALNFASGQYLTLADNPTNGTPALTLISNSFSISYWAKRNTTSINQYVIGMSDPTFSGSVHSNYLNKALHIGFRNPSATFDFYADSVNSPLTPTDTTTWHHYVMTYDADINQQRIVIDGDLLTAVSRTANSDFLGDINANTTAADIKNDFWIGRVFSGANFNGMVDDVRVYDGVLSDVDIYDLYSSASLPEASKSAVVTPFIGGDAGEGLDFGGAYVYAVNIGGNALYPPVVQGVVFTNDNLTAGVTVSLGGTGNLKGEYWGTRPEYGTSGDDGWLESMMQATALSYGTGPIVEVDLDVIAGRTYELQLLFSENVITNSASGRHFDITVEGVTILDEFTPIPAVANWTAAPHTGYAVTYEFVAGDSVANVDLTPGSTVGDHNPVVQAVTLKDITPPPASVSFNVWIESHGLIGDDAFPEADVEPDGLDNLAEYAFGGNPTNDDASAVVPVAYMEAQGGTRWFYHVHTERTNDPSLVVTLATATDLVDVTSWDNTNDLFWVGEAAAADGFKTVTNRTEAAADSKFILLNIEN